MKTCRTYIRRSTLPPQTKNVQAAIMECILEEVEAEKKLRLKHTCGARSEEEYAMELQMR